MLDYFKDWRMWLTAFAVFLIIEFPVCGEELKFDPPKKQSESIQLKFHDVKLKWRLNQLETKWSIDDSLAIRHKFTADDVDEYRTVVLFTIDF